MALDTDTINTAGMGTPSFGVKPPAIPMPAGPRPPSIAGRMAGAQTQIDDLSKQSADKQKEIEKANEDTITASRGKFEATREGEQKIVDEMARKRRLPRQRKKLTRM